MQCACAVLYCHVGCPALQHFSTVFHIQHNFRGKGRGELLHIKRVFWDSLQLLPDTFFILRRIQRDIIINVNCLHVKFPLLSSDFNEAWIISTDFRKILKYQISRKSVHWDPRFSMKVDGRAERQTHTTKLTVALRNFANAPKNNQLMLFREIIALCSQIHTKHKHTVWAESRICEY